MKSAKEQPKDIDSYIATFPPNIQKVLEKIRTTIRKAAPGAEEAIKYRMPTLILHGNLVHFAAFKNHIGLYPPVAGDAAFRKAVSAYEGPKGNLRFPLDEPIPYELITRMVQLRIIENRTGVGVKRKEG